MSHDHSKRTRSRILTSSGDGTSQPRGRKRWWPVATALLIVAVGISLLVPQARHQWALSLVRQPTRFTALSFERPGALPAQVVKNAPLTVGFTIANMEGRPLVYRYVLQASSPAGSAGSVSGTMQLESGESRSVSAVLRPTCRESPCKIEVSLPGYPETIDFLAAVVTGGAPHG